MQRDVEFEVEGVDKVGGFIGALYVGKTENVAVVLAREGFARVHGFAAEGLSWAQQLLEAEVSGCMCMCGCGWVLMRVRVQAEAKAARLNVSGWVCLGRSGRVIGFSVRFGKILKRRKRQWWGRVKWGH
jgi:hypothetical protein